MYLSQTTIIVAALILATPVLGLAQGRGFRGGRGPDKDFVQDRDTFHFLLENHKSIQRTVKEVEGGVETLTESDNPAIVKKIQEHVAAMYKRVEKPSPIRMRDPLFAELFRHSQKIKMDFAKTERGVKVRETSQDAHVAKLIREHAKVVSKFVKHGFDEAHKTHAVPE